MTTESKSGLIAGETGSGKASVLWTQPRELGGSSRSFAVMEDDSVLCADCVHEISDLEATRAEMTVHAWIDAGPAVCCAWCGTSEYADDGGRAER
jgi:hypothetical protein